MTGKKRTLAPSVFDLKTARKVYALFRDHHAGQIINTLHFAYHALRGFPSARLPYDPNWLVCLITARCNLHCSICSFRSSEGHHRKDHLFPSSVPCLPGRRRFQNFTPESFRKILDTFPRAINLELSGGEPFTNPSIFEIIQLAHERRLKVHIPTNGTLFAENIDALLKAPVDILNVSLYGTDAASFSQVTGANGSLFDATVEGVSELARRRRRGGYPRVLRTSFVCSKDNLHLAIDFIRLSEKLGVDEAKLRNLRFHESTGLPESLCLNAEDREVQAFFEGLRRQRFSIPVFLPRVPRHDDRRKCDHPFRIVAIDGDGFIGPCCMAADQRCWGNLFEQPDLWNGPAMIRARRDHMNPASPVPSICRYCEERIPERQKVGR